MSFESFSFGRHISDTPGPGTYSLPTKIGEGPKFTFRDRPKEKIQIFEPPILLLPSTLRGGRTTFGGRSKPIQVDDSLGPQFDIRRDIAKDLPKISFHSRHDLSTDETPGPSAYEIPRSLDLPPITILTGKRSDFVDYQDKPNPDKYVIPSDFDHHKAITIRDSFPAQKFDNDIPGPGMYNLISTDNDAPKISFPKEMKKEKKRVSQDPGPADYYSTFNTIGSPYEEKIKIPYSIGRKGTHTVLNTKKHDVPYHNIRAASSVRNITIGKKLITNYETCSPGPMYDNVSSLAQPKITIGKINKSNRNKSTTPSPDQYFKVPFVIPKEQPFKGFIGPMTRVPEEVAKSEWKPEPTKYNISRDISNMDKAYVIGCSRQMQTFKADTSAPYLPPVSSLAECKIVIGKRTEDSAY